MRLNSLECQAQAARMVDLGKGSRREVAHVFGSNLPIMVLVGFFAMVHRASANDSTLPPGTLVDAPVDVGRCGEAYSGVINPFMAGVYWFEIRYVHPREEVDTKSPGLPRKFGQPHHEAFGGKLRLEVVDVGSNQQLMASEPRWSPMEVSTSDGMRAWGDRMDFRLREGAEYKVRLWVEEATPALQSLRPRFMIEASDSARDQARGAGNFITFCGLFTFSLLILAVARRIAAGKGSASERDSIVPSDPPRHAQ